MCYIFSCFGWALDFIQRAVTFILACILCCFICCGIIVAIAAGVAYGYNYSMAEFLTFTRQDTVVYMRRGQFYDKPDFDTDKDVIYSRRTGGGRSGGAQNNTVDYQDPNAGAMRSAGVKSLPDSWSQAQDTRRYAEVLTKFSRKPVDSVDLDDDEDQELLSRPTPAPIPLSPSIISAVKRVSISPNPRVVETTLLENIVMRSFKPLASSKAPMVNYFNINEESGTETAGDQHGAFYADEDPSRNTKFFKLPQRPTIPYLPPVANDQKKETLPSAIPMRHWAATKPSSIPEPYLDYKEDIDEDNVVYKPI